MIAATEDIIAVLKDAISAIKNKRYDDLHGLSNHLIHSISIYQDEDLVDVAIAVYALEKVLTPERFHGKPHLEKFEADILEHLELDEDALEEKDDKKYHKAMKQLLALINKFNKKITFYVEDVLRFARVKKGSKMYEHGISLGAAAKAMGVTKWELMQAAGETEVHETFVEPLERERLKLVRKLFKVKE